MFSPNPSFGSQEDLPKDTQARLVACAGGNRPPRAITHTGRTAPCAFKPIDRLGAAVRLVTIFSFPEISLTVKFAALIHLSQVANTVVAVAVQY